MTATIPAHTTPINVVSGAYRSDWGGTHICGRHSFSEELFHDHLAAWEIGTTYKEHK
jgi:hypothetical protein